MSEKDHCWNVQIPYEQDRISIVFTNRLPTAIIFCCSFLIFEKDKTQKNNERFTAKRIGVCYNFSPRTKHAKPQSRKRNTRLDMSGHRHFFLSHTHSGSGDNMAKKNSASFEKKNQQFDRENQTVYESLGNRLAILSQWFTLHMNFSLSWLFHSINIQFSLFNFQTGCNEKSVWHSAMPFLSLFLSNFIVTERSTQRKH